jgi:hypothetical protein
MKQCIKDILKNVTEDTNLQAIKDKYSESRWDFFNWIY